MGVGSLTEVKVERDQAAQRSTSGKVTVTLAVQAQSFLWVAKELGLTADVPMIIDVFPVLFNLGVNEMQTVANSTGSVAIQTEINKKGVKLLRWYHSMFLNTGSNLSGPGSLIPIAGSETIPHLLDMLEKYVDVEAKEKSKNVEILLMSSHIARLMHGARTTSCKSAKDRTSVFHTLEVVRIATRMGMLDRCVLPPLLTPLLSG